MTVVVESVALNVRENWILDPDKEVLAALLYPSEVLVLNT